MAADEAAAVEAAVAEVPIRPRLRAVGRETSDLNAGVEEDVPEDEVGESSIESIVGGCRRECERGW